MKLKFLFPIISLSLSMTSFAQGSEMRLKFSPEQPKAGEPVTLIYTPLDAMTGMKTIPGVAYTYKNGKWKGHDISVSNDGQAWTGSFTPEPESGLMAFKFVADTIVDNNSGMGFAWMINKDDGRPWPEGYAAWAMLRTNAFGRDIPGYIDYSVTPAVSDTVVYYWVNNEITYNPSSAVAYAPVFARAGRAANINGIETRITNAKKYLSGIGTEEAYISLIDMTSDAAEVDSIRRIAVAKYSDGLVAMKKSYDTPFDYRDPKAISEKFHGFVKQFPPTPEREAYLNRYGQSYDNVYATLMTLDYMNGDSIVRPSYLDKLSYLGCATVFYKLIGIPHLRKDKSDEELLIPATMVVDRMNELRNVVPASRSYMSPSEWNREVDRVISETVAESYSEMLKNTRNYEKALDYARIAQDNVQYGRAEVNDNMAEILKALGKTSELKKLLENSYYNNQVSTMQEEMLREIYVAEKGSADGFEAYVGNLVNPDEKNSIRKEVEAYRVEGKMPGWSLKDASGNVVSSESLKGKVYVIDFWANWCHPCKSALPGMQLAVNHFKDDKDVEFLFIDTQEPNAGYQQKAVDYLKKKELDLHLVFDGPRAGSETNDLLCSQIMSMFHTSGIPLKIVVDGDGNIRFLSVGYKGSPSALRDEMVEMVNQAKTAL